MDRIPLRVHVVIYNIFFYRIKKKKTLDLYTRVRVRLRSRVTRGPVFVCRENILIPYGKKKYIGF